MPKTLGGFSTRRLKLQFSSCCNCFLGIFSASGFLAGFLSEPSEFRAKLRRINLKPRVKPNQACFCSNVMFIEFFCFAIGGCLSAMFQFRDSFIT